MFDFAPAPLFSTVAGLCSSYVVGQVIRANMPATTGLIQEAVVRLGTFGIGSSVSKVVTEHWQAQIALTQQMLKQAQEQQANQNR